MRRIRHDSIAQFWRPFGIVSEPMKYIGKIYIFRSPDTDFFDPHLYGEITPMGWFLGHLWSNGKSPLANSLHDIATGGGGCHQPEGLEYFSESI